MLALLLSTACAGTFFGASLYVNLVEHPARVSCGPELAVGEFAPSYKRGAVMQASLAIAALFLGVTAAWQLGDRFVAAAAVFLGSVVPYTLLVIFPTNRQLLDPSLDASSARASELLAHWNNLHAVRSALSAAAFGLLLWRIAQHGLR
ncbi:MAG TPA: DUF1772 domain-containing protein [Candidatus Eisenbacteria bacterium]|nr:DUF1772 domain-containing protein [Candidatus Eisenbacteria bacterium]